VKRIGFSAVFVLSLCSCLVFQSRQARDLYIEPGYAERIQRAELVLDSLTVQKGFDSQALEENAAYILQLMLLRRNQDASSAGNPLLLRAVIKEEEFTREFRSQNTVTVELSILDPQNTKAVALALYCENTRDTIDSYAYLHSVIRRAFAYLLR
jgi:hypothetical protein